MFHQNKKKRGGKTTEKIKLYQIVCLQNLYKMGKKGDWGEKKREEVSKNEQTKHVRAPDTQETGL